MRFDGTDCDTESCQEWLGGVQVQKERKPDKSAARSLTRRVARERGRKYESEHVHPIRRPTMHDPEEMYGDCDASHDQQSPDEGRPLYAQQAERQHKREC